MAEERQAREAELAQKVGYWWESVPADQEIITEEQLKTLLTMIDSSTPPDTEPSMEELQFVMRCCALKDLKSGAVQPSGVNVETPAETQDIWGLSRANVMYALSTFKDYGSRREQLAAIVAKHDVSGTGALKKEELKAAVSEMLGTGYEVFDEEIDELFAHADLDRSGDVDRAGLLYLLHWYSHLHGEDEYFWEKQQQQQQQQQKAKTKASSKKATCCSLQ